MALRAGAGRLSRASSNRLTRHDLRPVRGAVTAAPLSARYARPAALPGRNSSRRDGAARAAFRVAARAVDLLAGGWASAVAPPALTIRRRQLPVDPARRRRPQAARIARGGVAASARPDRSGRRLGTVALGPAIWWCRTVRRSHRRVLACRGAGARARAAVLPRRRCARHCSKGGWIRRWRWTRARAALDARYAVWTR
jgi:hypothetical protein